LIEAMAELLDTGLRLPMSFLHWWLDELRGLLPSTLSAAPQRSKTSLLLHLSGDETTLIERTPRLGERELDRAGSDELATSGLALSSFGDRRYRQWPVIVRLGGDLGLRKVVDLPLAARDDLGQLLHFELDRLTPFKADDVCFAWRILDTDAAKGRMQVELEMAQKAVVERALALVTRHGREVDHVELDGGGEREPLDLMPRSVEIGQGRRWYGRLLPLVALGLALIAIMLPLNKKQQLVERLERDIAVVRAEAEQSLAIRDQLDLLATKARFLAATKNQRLTMTEVLAELTRTLPDHSHITQLQIRDNSVELSGLADKASDLIAILDQSPLLASPAFQSPVTRDPRSDKERFQISVDLVERSP
jgi:general secretion pathway protein L